MNTRNRILIYFVFTCSVLAGCNSKNNSSDKHETVTPKANQSSIEMIEGVLKFKDYQTYRNTISKLEKNEKVLLPSGFVSLNDILEKVSEAEFQMFKYYYLTKQPPKSEIHSKEYNENKESVFYTKLENKTSILEMDIYTKALGMLVNKMGLVIVSDTLYIYSRYKADICLKFDEKILRNFSKTKDYKSMGIEVFPAISISKINNVAKTTSCDFCYSEDYHYQTTVWNPGALSNSYQSICEVFLEETRYPCSGFGVTESSVKMRGRFLTRFFGSGNFLPFFPADIYFSGEFSGPRSPETYYYTNGFSMFWVGFGTDMSLTHCKDLTIGKSDCFSITHAKYTMVSQYDTSSPTVVAW